VEKRYRAIVFLVLLFGLFALSYYVTKAPGIPSGDKSIWFHSGLLVLIFSSFWVEHFYTKPADAVINALVVVISISSLNQPPNPSMWEMLRWYAMTVCVLAFTSSYFSQPPQNEKPHPIKRFVYFLATRLGNAKVMFTLVFMLSLVSYFDFKATETKIMVVFWGSILLLKEIDLASLLGSAIGLVSKGGEDVIGSIAKINYPNIVTANLLDGRAARRGTLVAITRNENIEPDSPLAVISGSKLTPEKTEIEAIILDSTLHDHENNPFKLMIKVSEDDKRISERLASNTRFNRAKTLIGFAKEGTDISTLVVEMISKPDIEEGHLTSAGTGSGKEVLYQIVNAKLNKEIVLEGSENNFTVATAQQIGTWSDPRQGFETHSWVVSENCPVYHVTPGTIVDKKIVAKRTEIGSIPNSQYPVNININDLTLFHSALLGVTGSGKSFLAYHLIESVAKEGVKVLCLDVTGDYKRYLRGAVQLMTSGAVKPFLDSPSERIGIVEFQEKSHPIDSTLKIAELAYDWCKTNRKEEEIKEPTPKILIVLEEAHTLVPEWQFNPDRSKQDIVNKVAQTVLQARKYGLGFMVITQRTANVTKSILNQCNTIFAFQAYDETGFDFMKNYMGQRYVESLPNLKKRHGVVVGKASVSDRPVIVRFQDQAREANAQTKEFVPPPVPATVQTEVQPRQAIVPSD